MSITVYNKRPEGGTIKPFRMPGGEWHVNDGTLDESYIAVLYGASADDLVALRILSDAVHRDGGTLSAGIPYLPGARQDRRQPGEALSAKVYADLINACDLRTVVALDPHSDVITSHVDNLVLLDLSTVFVEACRTGVDSNWAGIIVPDAGAGKRAELVAKRIREALPDFPTFQALKHRDTATGKLSGFTCEPLPDNGHKRFLVVDDICDGGGTFKGLAIALGVPSHRLDLWVSHGIFSSGAETLSVYFNQIITTNSFPGPDIPGSKRADITPLILNTIRSIK